MNDEQKAELEDLKSKAIEYLDIAEKAFTKGGSLELALGYQQCKRMIEHAHELVVDYVERLLRDAK